MNERGCRICEGGNVGAGGKVVRCCCCGRWVLVVFARAGVGGALVVVGATTSTARSCFRVNAAAALSLKQSCWRIEASLCRGAVEIAALRDVVCAADSFCRGTGEGEDEHEGSRFSKMSVGCIGGVFGFGGGGMRVD